MWEKIADTLNKCSMPKFRVDKRSVRDHVEILVYKHKKKLQAEEKATGITPDEPTELENLLDTIIALEESGGKWRSGITGNTGDNPSISAI